MHITAEEIDPEPIALVSSYLDVLWGWCTNLAYVGVHARRADGTKVPAGHADADKPYVRWDTALHYQHFAKERATTIMPDGLFPSLPQEGQIKSD